MKLDILLIHENLLGYIEEVESGKSDVENAWNKYAIDPYWDIISQWAPFDMSERKPKPIKQIDKLKKAIDKLKMIDVDKLREQFMMAVDALKNYDDDPIVIALYPSCDEHKSFFKKQNGVVGSCIYGNMIIAINPIADDYISWIPYVFAHEYHHSVYGNYWNVVHGGLTGKFVEAVIADGLADSFARQLFGALVPEWHKHISTEEEKRLWENEYMDIMDKTDIDYCKYMFGNKSANIPWCTGYYIGYQIVQSYIKRHPGVSVKELIEKEAALILRDSKYQNEYIN